MTIQPQMFNYNTQSVYKPFLNNNTYQNNVISQAQTQTPQVKTSVKKNGDILKDIIPIPIGGVFGGVGGKLFQLQKEKSIKKQCDELWNNILNFSETPRIKNFYNDSSIARSYTKLYVQADIISLASAGRFELPNCVLFEGKDELMRKKTMDFFRALSGANYTQIDIYQDDLLDTLGVLEKNYAKTKKWNLLYVKNMDDFINRNVVDGSVVESMKAIMCCCAQDFKTTLLFETKNSELLDEIALEPNRITGWYCTDKMKHLDEYISTVSKYLRLENLEYALKKKKTYIKWAGFGAAIGLGIALTHFFMKLKGGKDENKQ